MYLLSPGEPGLRVCDYWVITWETAGQGLIKGCENIWQGGMSV